MLPTGSPLRGYIAEGRLVSDVRQAALLTDAAGTVTLQDARVVSGGAKITAVGQSADIWYIGGGGG